MIYTENEYLVVKLHGFGKEDIPYFLTALSDVIKYIEPKQYGVFEHSEAFYYLGVLMQSFTPSPEQFFTMNLSKE